MYYSMPNKASCGQAPCKTWLGKKSDGIDLLLISVGNRERLVLATFRYFFAILAKIAKPYLRQIEPESTAIMAIRPGSVAILPQIATRRNAAKPARSLQPSQLLRRGLLIIFDIRRQGKNGESENPRAPRNSVRVCRGSKLAHAIAAGHSRTRSWLCLRLRDLPSSR